MSKQMLAIVAVTSLVLAACGGSEPETRRIQAVPQNPADLDITGIASVEIAPGLTSRTLVEGDGATVEAGHTAVVHYTGWLYDPDADKNRGTKFDSSVDRGAHFRFPVGAGRVIRGWDEGVAGMKIGEVRELTISPDMGYGDRGAGTVIPPGATLVFVVELADIEGLESDAAESQ
jgi:FKBP-type peptidyl-prolyl cis-trans isomerase